MDVVWWLPEDWACPECGAWSPEDAWATNAEVGCSDCGSHPAVRCPECGDLFDEIGWRPESRRTAGARLPERVPSQRR